MTYMTLMTSRSLIKVKKVLIIGLPGIDLKNNNVGTNKGNESVMNSV